MDPVSHSMVKWFLAIASSVERMTVFRYGIDVPDFLPQLLALAGTAAPNLRILVLMSGDGGAAHLGGAEIQSLAFLSQLKDLKINCWQFPLSGSLTDIQQLSGLLSLKVLFVFGELLHFLDKCIDQTF